MPCDKLTLELAGPDGEIEEFTLEEFTGTVGDYLLETPEWPGALAELPAFLEPLAETLPEIGGFPDAVDQRVSDQNWHEVSRETTVVQVEDPESEAMIEVERIDKITFGVGSVTGRKITLHLDWT